MVATRQAICFALLGLSIARSTGASCSMADQAMMKALPLGTGPGSFGSHSSECGRKAFSLFWGLDENEFMQCIRGRVALSYDCAACYKGATQHGIDNCKLPCMMSWCSKACLRCSHKYTATLDSCTGFPSALPASCDDVVV